MKSEPRVGFVSLGCPKALVDSEHILTQLRAEGYGIAPSYRGADLVVVNTCGFIDAAVEESLDAIGEALAENWEEARGAVQRSPLIHSDETSWFNNHHLQWLWHASTPQAVLFQILPARSEQSARILLGDPDPARILVSDRFTAYLRWPTRQYCWAHLKRDFVKMSERPAAEGMIGRVLVGLTQKLFTVWRQHRNGRCSREESLAALAPLREALESSIVLGSEFCDTKTGRTCQQLVTGKAHLWRFLTEDGVEPTNNEAERGIRPAVIWRKLSLGTHSDAGMRFVERMLTITGTLQKQGRAFFAFLEEAVACYLQGRPAPRLIEVSWEFAPSF